MAAKLSKLDLKGGQVATDDSQPLLDRPKLDHRQKWVRERDVRHPSSKFRVVVGADGLDRGPDVFGWNDDNRCRVREFAHLGLLALPGAAVYNRPRETRTEIWQ